jgi:hypothetical protein
MPPSHHIAELMIPLPPWRYRTALVLPTLAKWSYCQSVSLISSIAILARNAEAQIFQAQRLHVPNQTEDGHEEKDYG